MGKAIFADLTRCTACRGCQIACKQWKNLPGEETRNRGSHQNPPDLSDKTLRLVRFTETKVDGRLEWLFFPEQCRHCYSPPCVRAARDVAADILLHDEATGAVYPGAAARKVGKDDAREIRDACPYDIPRPDRNGKGVFKCDFCLDRISNSMVPSCVLSCPTGSLVFGDEEDIRVLADKRLKEVRRRFPKAYLGDPEGVRVIYLYQTDHRLYYQDPAE
jgi:formate dehydrogenase iron-sulfur subunit